jgi:hypothetical protein
MEKILAKSRRRKQRGTKSIPQKKNYNVPRSGLRNLQGLHILIRTFSLQLMAGIAAYQSAAGDVRACTPAQFQNPQ